MRRACMLLCVGLVVAAAACNADQGNDSMQRENLEGQWEIEMVADDGGHLVPPVEGTAPYLVLTNTTVYGNAGCNTFSGSATADPDGSFESGMFNTTLIGCPDPLAAQDGRITAALSAATSWNVNGETAELRDGTLVVMKLRALDTSLPGSHWLVTSINNGRGGVQSVISGTEATLWFDEGGRFSGTTGCNDINSTYALEDHSLSFGPIASTRKACFPAEKMEQEQQLLAALGSAAEFAIVGPTLRITDRDGSTLIVGKRLPAPTP